MHAHLLDAKAVHDLMEGFSPPTSLQIRPHSGRGPPRTEAPIGAVRQQGDRRSCSARKNR